MPTLREVRGDELCHICGKPRAERGGEWCSYPHALIPTEQVAPGMWAWSEPSPTNPNKE